LDEITIPYHLAIPTIICVVGLVIILIYRNRLFSKKKLFWTSLTIFLVLYLFIVGSATFDDIYYQWDLNRYDLDKDGMFGGVEITDEQNEAMRKLTNDTGRNFSFITGFIFALFISTAVYISGRVILKLKRQ
jgi:phosphoglycerol transferase MdoB-like AlkP superfamily enzyme